MSTRKTWSSEEIRECFLGFFEKNDHLRIGAAPLVPKNDPTLLYINSGMAPLKKYFTGAERPPHPDLCNVQTCIRTRDIDDVGDRHHMTFFEMLGSWSIGRYFKQRAVELAYDLLVNVYKYPAEKLFVTVYRGDPARGHEPDDETARAWESVGVPRSRIVYLGADNFWGPAGDSGPCGPCTEVFYDTGDEYGPAYQPGGDFDSKSRYIEIWNAGVFMQYDQQSDGRLVDLPFKSVDTGSGLERMTMILNGLPTVYETDLVKPFMDLIAAGFSGGGKVSEHRLLADHLRASTFILSEGVTPGNEGQAYIPRRLIRKCVAVTTRAGIPGFDYGQVIDSIIEQFAPHYPHLEASRKQIHELFGREKKEFERTLARGLDRLEALCSTAPFVVPGADAFSLLATYGLPFELVRDFVRERGGEVDEDSFEIEYKKHQTISRAEGSKAGGPSAWPTDETAYARLPDDARDTEFIGYAETSADGAVRYVLIDGKPVDQAGAGAAVEVILDRTPFYAEGGGQVGDRGVIKSSGAELAVEDTQRRGSFHLHRARVQKGAIRPGDKVALAVDGDLRGDTMSNHSATHLLHAVLREVLGTHVKQAGSLVEDGRLRFDFEHPQKVTAAELQEIERQVNFRIRQNWPRLTETSSYQDAVKSGVLAFFKENYGDKVRVVRFGPVSAELCGGTHVERTGDIGAFRILSEQSVASGVRRIVAMTGRGAIEYTLEQAALLSKLGGLLKSDPKDLPQRIEALLQKKKDSPKPAQRQNDALEPRQLADGTMYFIGRMDGEKDTLRAEALRLADQVKGIAALAGEDAGTVRLVVAVAKQVAERFNANSILRQLAPLVDGKGGGAPHLAQGGGQKVAGISDVIQRFPEILGETAR
jgi:alanyl-tRNA synthetase